MNLRAGGWWLVLLLGLTRPAPGQPAQVHEAAAQAALATVRAAVARVDQVKLSDWAYIVATTNGSESKRESHDPARGPKQPWQLLLKNGKEPTEKERKKHADERRRHGAGLAGRKLSDLIDRHSLQFDSQDARQIRCAFRLKVSDEDTRFVIDKLRGTLTVNRATGLLESVDVANTERISKTGVLSLSELRIHAQYRPDPARGDPLLQSCWSRVRGRVLMVKSINSDSQIQYSDHRWVGPAGTTTPGTKPVSLS